MLFNVMRRLVRFTECFSDYQYHPPNEIILKKRMGSLLQLKILVAKCGKQIDCFVATINYVKSNFAAYGFNLHQATLPRFQFCSLSLVIPLEPNFWKKSLRFPFDVDYPPFHFSSTM